MVGYLVISNDPNGSTSDTPVITDVRDLNTTSPKGFAVYTSGRTITCSEKNIEIYSSTGQKIAPGERVSAGIYFVTDGRKTTKVIVR